MKNLLLTFAAFALLMVVSAFSYKLNDKVFICTDTTSKVFHSVNTCQDLKGCKGDQLRITQKEAETQYLRTACKVCY